MNRRNFLYSSAALAAPFAAGMESAQAQTASSSSSPEDIKLGVATYSLREFQRDLCIKQVKSLGVQYVDVKEFHLPQTDPVPQLEAGRKAFDKAGLKVIGGGNISLTEPDEAGLRKHFDYAKAVGFPMMICAPRHENLAAIEKLAIEYNMKMAIHNHGPEDAHFPTPASVLDAIKNMDARMGLCMDIGHTCRAGADPVEWIDKAGPRLFEMHSKDLKDTKWSKGQSASLYQCPVGDGIIPYPTIFRHLKQIGYKGVVSLEYEIDGDDPIPGMQKSFSYMRGVLAGLRA
jgi:sugar phosphate isomerase/epimerase